MKHVFATITLLLLGAQAVLAQDAGPTLISPTDAINMPRVPSIIHTVEIVAQEEQPTLLIFGTLPDGCERETLVTKERQGTMLFVDVYHAPVPASVVPCPEALLPLALTIPAEELLTLDEEATLPSTLVVNDQYYAIQIAQIEPMPEAGLPPIMLSPLTRIPVNVHALATQVNEDGFVNVIVKGVQTQGCSDPILSRVFPLAQTTDSYKIDVFQAVAEPDACPDTYVAVSFEVAVKTPVKEDAAGVFLVDGKKIEYAPESEGSTMHIFHTIDTVEAVLMESFPVQIALNIKGYQPDGCEAPVQIEQSREENMVTVQIFRDLPSDAVCPMAFQDYAGRVKLEGGFEPGTYIIDVNGTVITVKI